jgi:hypothetical protein
MNKALQMYLKGLAIDPEDIEILSVPGIMSIQNCLFAKASISYGRFRELKPDNQDALRVIDLRCKQQQTSAPDEGTHMLATVSKAPNANKTINNTPETNIVNPSWPPWARIH